MTTTHNLGFPSIGHKRELKKALEFYWQGQCDDETLVTIGRHLRAKHWHLQQETGLDWVPVGEFSYYDRMLDMICLLGAVPKRFGFYGEIGFAEYFALARGNKAQPALEMTKWFDTNYHYIVPEFTAETTFEAFPEKFLGMVEEALQLNLAAKPVLIGPLTFLYLGKEKEDGFDRLSLLPRLIPAYQSILSQLKARGIEWVQLDEPALALDLPQAWVQQLQPAYKALAQVAPKILLTTYFESVGDSLPLLKSLPVAGLHLDLTAAADQLEAYLSLPDNADQVLSVGVVDGRGIWKTDLQAALSMLEKARLRLGDRLWVAPGCSLLHVPVDLAQETTIEPELKDWLAFGLQKLQELNTLRQGLDLGASSIQGELAANRQSMQNRAHSGHICNPQVRERIRNLSADAAMRQHDFSIRQKRQQEKFRLPLFPTTTIGSFPQTDEIRELRSASKKGKISGADYEFAMRSEIRECIEMQEKMGLDVLVHGEPERNDMVEYFGEQLQGFAFTQHGWVQSYGSRCVKPPVIYGDVWREQSMTVSWIRYAQSLTTRPVKGMLTGPVTILQWSFYRNDQSREETALQIALAIRDEVCDLEQAGIRVIQIDEPAYREGLPLKRKDWNAYLEWASRVFRVAASGVGDDTQIHTHMCYSEFHDIMPAIAAMDADVITIEASRSDLELLQRDSFHYPNEIGPGVYDVHSPEVPEVGQMVALLEKMRGAVADDNLWVNPDCGLKTRQWKEVKPALENMVAAARQLREKVQPEKQVSLTNI